MLIKNKGMNLSMSNILLTRVDNRLIHGQIAVGWTNYVGANLIIVANDEVAEDTIQQNLMDLAVPSGVQTRYFTIKETIEKVPLAAEHQKMFIIVRDLPDVLALVEGDIGIDNINLGNLHYEKGKRQITNSIAISDSDEKNLNYLREKDIALIVRRVPEERGESIFSYL